MSTLKNRELKIVVVEESGNETYYFQNYKFELQDSSGRMLESATTLNELFEFVGVADNLNYLFE